MKKMVKIIKKEKKTPIISMGVSSDKTKKTAKPTKKVSSTLMIAGEREIAADFATKVYEKFDQIIKSIVLFGSSDRKSVV